MDAHEQLPNQENQAANAAREIINKMLKDINSSSATQEQKDQQKSDIAIKTIREYKQAQEALKNLKEREKTEDPTEELQEKIQTEQTKLGVTLIKACVLAKNDIPVVDNKKAQGILKGLSETNLTDTEAFEIQDMFGEYLLGDKTGEIILSKSSETKSKFVENIILLAGENPAAARKFLNALILGSSNFGMGQEEITKVIWENLNPGQSFDDLNNNYSEDKNIKFSDNPIINKEMHEAGLSADYPYLQLKFTKDQLDLVTIFYSPTAFIQYLENLGKQASDGTTDPVKVSKEKDVIKSKIKKHFEKKPPKLKTGETLDDKINEELQKQWDEKTCDLLKREVSLLVNNLFLILQLKAPQKFYDEVLQKADPFYGPAPILNKIQTAINKLMTTTTDIEKKGDIDDSRYKKIKKLKFYRREEDDSYIDERDGKLYPRIKPIPIAKEIKMHKFIENIGTLIETIQLNDEYFLNSRAIYNHPAGEKGFYEQLGGFAEKLNGSSIDEIMLLPDGKYVLDAYHIYEKFLKEDFSSLDWHHRSDQFQPKLDEVNSKLELEIIKTFQAYYPDMNEMRIRSFVNSAIGISRGLTLTEPETSAYGDAINAEGEGLVSSYSTNDAQSLNVFNSQHNSLRWQGEHNWNLLYFMPVEGRKGPWEHKEAKQNMANWMEALKRGKGKKELPELFVDILMNINKIGGISKRKGWRQFYSLEGHFEYDPDGTINAPKTFRAMEAIGYEALSNFIETNQLGDRLLKATDKTTPDQVKERNKMFREIYIKYIDKDPSNFKESEFQDYLARVNILGVERAIDHVKKHKTGITSGTWDEQVAFASSQIFMENTLTYYTAARMPTLLIKIDKNRNTKDGESRREKIHKFLYEQELAEMKKIGKDVEGGKKVIERWTNDNFSKAMKNIGLVETLLRREISDKIYDEMPYDEKFGLHQIDEIEGIRYRINADVIKDILSKNSKGERLKSDEEIEMAVELWEAINDKYFISGKDGVTYLDKEAFVDMKNYPFTFGLEDTDMSLIAYRGTGPRMVARSIKDIGGLEQTCTPWLMNMPNMLSIVAVDGKHDFTSIIEYLLKAKKAINDVHGSEAAQEFVFKVSTGVINYFKRDGWAKPLLGGFRFGKINSIAGEYASSSNAVWEWESKQIDSYCLALRTHRLLPGTPYDLNKTENGVHTGGKLEDVWWINPITKKPFKTFFKKRHIDFVWNVDRLRKEHGAHWSAIGWDYFNKYVPIFLIALLFKYLKDALEEMTGKKK